MGTSSAALFDDDVAHDVRQQLLALLGSGEHPKQAIEAMAREWAAPGADIEEVAIFWLALAATAWEYGCLDEELKARALGVITDGTDLRRWQGVLAAERLKVLDGLKARLLHSQPKPKLPSAPKTVEEPPSVEVKAPDGRSCAVAFSIAGSGITQVYIERAVGNARGGGSVFAAECPLDTISMSWRGDGALSIGYPAGLHIHKRSTVHFFHGEAIEVIYVERSGSGSS